MPRDGRSRSVACVLQRRCRLESMINMREQWQRLRTDWASARSQYPRLASAVALASLLLLIATIGGGAWTLRSLRDGLPDEQALSRIGEMDQATAVYDVHDRPVDR